MDGSQQCQTDQIFIFLLFSSFCCWPPIPIYIFCSKLRFFYYPNPMVLPHAHSHIHFFLQKYKNKNLATFPISLAISVPCNPPSRWHLEQAEIGDLPNNSVTNLTDSHRRYPWLPMCLRSTNQILLSFFLPNPPSGTLNHFLTLTYPRIQTKKLGGQILDEFPLQFHGIEMICNSLKDPFMLFHWQILMLLSLVVFVCVWVLSKSKYVPVAWSVKAVDFFHR